MTSVYRFVQLDARKGTDQLTADEWVRTLGFEVTAPALAAACGLGNCEGQHGIPGTPAEWVGRPAVEIATRMVPAYPVSGAILAFLEPDVDAVAAAALVVLLAIDAGPGFTADGAVRGWSAETRARVALIAERDGFSPGAAWAPRPLPTVANPWGERWNIVTRGGEGWTAIGGYVIGSAYAEYENLPTEAAARALILRCLAAHNAGLAAEAIVLTADDFSVESHQAAAPVSETQSLGPLSVICSPASGQFAHPLAVRVAVVACWLLWGDPMVSRGARWEQDDREAVAARIFRACGVEHEFGYDGLDSWTSWATVVYDSASRAATEARLASARALQSGETKIRIALDRPPAGGFTYEGDGLILSMHDYEAEHSYTGRSAKIAVVDYGSYGALGIGYCVAPVVVATGLPVDGGGRKFTIAAWSPRYVDFPGLVAAFNAAEVIELNQMGLDHGTGTQGERVRANGWGGNLASGIVGSPQNEGSVLGLDEIVKIVRSHLTEA